VPTHDGRYVAYSVKENNSDETNDEDLRRRRGQGPVRRPDGDKYSGASWTPDGKGFYYTFVPPVEGKVTIAERPGFAELRFHKVGTDQATDLLVHPATGSAKTFLGGASRAMATG